MNSREGTKRFLLFSTIPVKEENFCKVYWDLSGFSFKDIDLSNAALFKVDLRGANLKGVNCRGSSFANSWLQNADLRGADLSRTDLSGANLSGADLTGVNLEGANLEGANLENANLSGANTIGANFDRTQLNGTDFTGIKIKKTPAPPNPPKMYLYNPFVIATPAGKLVLVVKRMFGTVRHYCSKFLFGLDRKDID